MKLTSGAFLRLYLKAGWWLTAIVALWVLVSVIASPGIGSLGWFYSYLVLLIYMPFLAHYFLSVDKLLLSVGLPTFKRMTLMFTAWALHFSFLAVIFALALAVKPFVWSQPLPGYYFFIATYETWSFLPLLFLSIALVLGFVDFQARRLAGLSMLDSVFITVIGQVTAFLALLGFLGIFNPPVPPFAHSQGALLIPAAATLLALAFAASRVLSAHSLLKESELA